MSEVNTNLNREIIDAALSGNPVETTRLFNQAMDDRITDKVDDLRPEVAATYLTPADQDTTADETDHE